jgi:hypothetical protein
VIAALDAGDVTLAAGVLGFCWLVVQFFDRLYGSKSSKQENARVTLQQSSECGIQHTNIANQMQRVHELVAAQTAAQAEMNRALASLAASTERQAMAADYRHREILDAVKERT